MTGKILCKNDPNRTAAALKWAREQGADFVSPGNKPKEVYALFVTGKTLSWTDAKETFENALEPDITEKVFPAKNDSKKARLSLVPVQMMFDIAEVREYGTKKYGDKDNWKRVSAERYREAAFRHFLRYLEDPDSVDEESGLSHLSHLATNISFLCALRKKAD